MLFISERPGDLHSSWWESENEDKPMSETWLHGDNYETCLIVLLVYGTICKLKAGTKNIIPFYAFVHFGLHEIYKGFFFFIIIIEIILIYDKLRSQIMNIAMSLNQAIFNSFQTK